jgi:hypothetical protein
MGYYIPLDLEAQKLCKTILPWGKYKNKRLPMGVKTSPYIFQRIMYDLLGDIPNIQVYLDDIVITSNGICSNNVTSPRKTGKGKFQSKFTQMLFW